MARFTTCIVFAISIATIGCGKSELHQTRGRVFKGGEEFIPPEGENLQIALMPIMKNGEPPRNYYFASVDQETGTFFAAGPQLQGVPAGKYRVTVELMKQKKDQFRGRFDADRSPFVIEITGDEDEIEIDLDNSPPEVAYDSD